MIYLTGLSTNVRSAVNPGHQVLTLPGEEDVEMLKKSGFTEVDAQSGLNSWMMSYLTVTNPGFKRSKKNLAKLKNQKDQPIQDVLAYLLEESENEIKRLKSMTVEEVNQHLLEKKSTQPIEEEGVPLENLDDKILEQVIYEQMKTDIHPLSNTEHLLQILEKILEDDTVKDKTTVISLDQMVEAFELVKLIPNKAYRLKGQFLAGQLIYGLNKVRLDPGNESFYIDSLLYFRKMKTASKLFESYKSRVEERWWYEVGLMVYLRSNKLQKFNVLYQETREKFGTDYIRPDVLILAIKKHLNARRLERAKELTQDISKMIEIYGWEDDTSSVHKGYLNFNSSEEANDFLNEVQRVSKRAYVKLLSSYFLYGYKEEGFRLLGEFEQTNNLEKDLFEILSKKLKLQWLKEFSTFVREYTPYLSPLDSTDKIQRLKGWYEESLREQEITEFRDSFRYLLYDSIDDLLQMKNLSGALEKSLLTYTSTTDADAEPSEIKNKRLQMVMKLLLMGGREESALNILSELEKSKRERSGHDTANAGVSAYPPVTSHHYLPFIQYYGMKSSKQGKKMLVEIIKRINYNNVEMDAFMFTTILKCLIRQQKYQDSILLVNKILSSKQKAGKTIPVPLYKQIWKTMIEQDSTLLNSELVNAVLDAFAKNREWNNILPVMLYIHDVQMLEIPERRIEYYRRGLKRDFIDQLKYKIRKYERSKDSLQVSKYTTQLRDIEEKLILNNLMNNQVSAEENFSTFLHELNEYLELIGYSRVDLNATMTRLGEGPEILRKYAL
ncbi:hypothetical protein C6P43_003188 [Kluyveromyces marxianus]|nr:hypothetical protein C6P43_003188 [Kluyveromyces marxianus]